MEIWELTARESIRELVARYNCLGDTCRIGEKVDLFAPDAVLELAGGLHEIDWAWMEEER